MNKIKEKLLKEIKHIERMKDGDLQLDYEVTNKLFRHSLAERILWELKAKLQQHEETSKAKDEKFINLLDKLIKKIENADKQIEFDEWETFMIFNIQEIKQRIKEE